MEKREEEILVKNIFAREMSRNFEDNPMRICLEDVLEWIQTGGEIDGVHFDEQSVMDSIKEVLYG